MEQTGNDMQQRAGSGIRTGPWIHVCRHVLARRLQLADLEPDQQVVLADALAQAGLGDGVELCGWNWTNTHVTSEFISCISSSSGARNKKLRAALVWLRIISRCLDLQLLNSREISPRRTQLDFDITLKSCFFSLCLEQFELSLNETEAESCRHTTMCSSCDRYSYGCDWTRQTATNRTPHETTGAAAAAGTDWSFNLWSGSIRSTKRWHHQAEQVQPRLLQRQHGGSFRFRFDLVLKLSCSQLTPKQL